jgi:hypothetical protein
MAGEYSRELSVKVFAGQANLIRLGYRQGGQPGSCRSFGTEGRRRRPTQFEQFPYQGKSGSFCRYRPSAWTETPEVMMALETCIGAT